MPKVKIKEFKGIATNFDENDVKLEVFNGSLNVRHRGSFAEVEPRQLAEYNLPDPNAEFGIYGYNFEWETGIYCILSGDKFKSTSDRILAGDKYNVLVLVAKAYKDNKYHRLIYLRDFTNPGLNYWIELSKYGANEDTFVSIVNHRPADLGEDRFSNSFFSTELDGEAFFKTDRGNLKLYLPHDAFWIGKWNRKIKVYNADINEWDGTIGTKPNGEGVHQWYIDRLVEPFDQNAIGMIGDTNHLFCAPGRRLGWRGEVTVATDIDLEQREINYIGNSGDPGLWGALKDHDGFRKVKAYAFDGWFKDDYSKVPATINFAFSSPVIAQEPEWESLFLYGATCEWPGGNEGIAIPIKFFDYYGIYNPITGEDIDPSTLGWHRSLDANTYDNYAVKKYFNDGTYGGATVPWTWYENSTINYFEIYGTGFWHLPLNTIWTTRPVLSFRYKGSGTVSEKGFDITNREFALVVTALLDDRDEVVVSAKKYVVPPTINSKWIPLVKNIKIPVTDMNLRVTRYRYYFKLRTDVDFDLVKEHDFIKATEVEGPIADFFTVYPDTRSDIYLSTNIGFLLNENRFYDYQPLTGFKSAAIKDRISVAIATGDYAGAFYNVVGGGNIQSDVILTQNRLLIPNSASIVAVSTVSDTILLVTDKETFLIKPDEALGQLVFSIRDTLEYGIKDRNDLVEMKGAIILHTRKGIFITDGYKTKSLSEPIDDIIFNNYANGNIRYNPVLHELYYFINTTETFYRYRFQDQVWESINLLLDSIPAETPLELPEYDGSDSLITNLADFLVDFQGENAYLQPQRLLIKSGSVVNIPYGLITNETDFGYIDTDKLLNYADIDYTGTVRLHYFYDSEYQGFVQSSTSTVRTSSWLYIPLAKRRPFKKIRFFIELVGSTAKLYSIEFDINPLKRRRS